MCDRIRRVQILFRCDKSGEDDKASSGLKAFIRVQSRTLQLDLDPFELLAVRQLYIARSNYAFNISKSERIFKDFIDAILFMRIK